MKFLAASFAREIKSALKIYVAAAVVGTATLLAISSITGQKVVELWRVNADPVTAAQLAD